MIKITDGRAADWSEVVLRRDAEQHDVSATVRDIINNVKTRGDSAVLEYTERFDGVKLSDMRVSEAEIEAAKESVGAEFLDVLESAAANIRAFHKMQKREGFVIDDAPGIVLGQKITPLGCAGIYVPGGTAPYPSTVLMDAIPAKIAGVSRIIMTTPPGRDGKINDGILAAAGVSGIDEIYKIGGAQAIAALAYGTESIPRVDKIVGPGNIFVATAKKLVYGVVDIDMIAGPSDILIIADSSANPKFVAADMLGQSEHDKLSSSVLVTDSEVIANETAKEIGAQLENLPRKDIAAASIENNGQIILARDVRHAVEIANAIAPEHLEVCTDDPFELLPLIQNAGSIFLGHYTPEALGDYFAGPNHTLPTEGTSRFFSPLSVDDFIKKSSYISYSRDALDSVAQKVETFARREGLDAHANSITIRKSKN